MLLRRVNTSKASDCGRSRPLSHKLRGRMRGAPRRGCGVAAARAAARFLLEAPGQQSSSRERRVVQRQHVWGSPWVAHSRCLSCNLRQGSAHRGVRNAHRSVLIVMRSKNRQLDSASLKSGLLRIFESKSVKQLRSFGSLKFPVANKYIMPIKCSQGVPHKKRWHQTRHETQGCVLKTRVTETHQHAFYKIISYVLQTAWGTWQESQTGYLLADQRSAWKQGNTCEFNAQQSCRVYSHFVWWVGSRHQPAARSMAEERRKLKLLQQRWLCYQHAARHRWYTTAPLFNYGTFGITPIQCN